MFGRDRPQWGGFYRDTPPSWATEEKMSDKPGYANPKPEAHDSYDDCIHKLQNQIDGLKFLPTNN